MHMKSVHAVFCSAVVSDDVFFVSALVAAFISSFISCVTFIELVYGTARKRTYIKLQARDESCIHVCSCEV